MNESPEILKYIWYPELEIYGLDTFGRQRVLKEMSGLALYSELSISTINPNPISHTLEQSKPGQKHRHSGNAY